MAYGRNGLPTWPDGDLNAAFAITAARVGPPAATAAEVGKEFANALARYRDANGQVPTFYLAIYGEEEL